MSELKAVVLEKRGSTLTVLSSEGSFRRIRYKGQVEIGQEIEIPKVRSIPSLRIATSMVAVFLVVILGLFGWNLMLPNSAAAMISVDINPSLQLTLDRKGRVLELATLNQEGDLLLSELSLKGEPWEDALRQIIEKSVLLEYLNPEQTWVVVGYSSMETENNLKETGINSENIADKIDEVAEEKGVSPSVAVYELTPEEKVQADEKGLSLGEYALVNTAQKAGVEVKPEIVKKANERVLLLEKPEVQQQLKKDKRLIKEALKTSFSDNSPFEMKDNDDKNGDWQQKNKKNQSFTSNKLKEFDFKDWNNSPDKNNDKKKEKINEMIKNRQNPNQKVDNKNKKEIKNTKEEPSRGGSINRHDWDESWAKPKPNDKDKENSNHINNGRNNDNKRNKINIKNSSNKNNSNKDNKNNNIKENNNFKRKNNFSKTKESNSSAKSKVFNPWYLNRDERN